MFDIGFAEILIVAVVALVVLGPEKLPSAVRTLGLWVSRIRRTVGAIQSEISEELRIDEIRRATSIKKDELEKELSDMRQPFGVLDDDSPIAAKTTSPEELKESEEALAEADTVTGDEMGKVDK